MSELYRLAYQYTGDPHSAEDLLQDTLVYICQREEKLLSLDPLKPWLMRCLYHRFVDHYRKTKRTVNTDSIDEEVHDVASHCKELESQLIREEVFEGLKGLNEVQRAVVTLFDMEGYSLQEVSSFLELPQGTVKSHLHRARKKLKIFLSLQPGEGNERLNQYAECLN